MRCGNLLRCDSPEEETFVIIADITKKSIAYRFLMKLETDVEHLCKMKAAEWESTLTCGVFIVELREDISGFLSKDLKACNKQEKKNVRDCLREVRKILRVLQMAYATKVSSLTIHSMVSDMRNYIRETRTALGKLNL
jgi:hypothetical protein